MRNHTITRKPTSASQHAESQLTQAALKEAATWLLCIQVQR